MINLLGYESAQSEYLPQRKEIEQLGAFVHWYGKTESRQGRKLGHVTVLLDEKSPEKNVSPSPNDDRKSRIYLVSPEVMRGWI